MLFVSSPGVIYDESLTAMSLIRTSPYLPISLALAYLCVFRLMDPSFSVTMILPEFVPLPHIEEVYGGILVRIREAENIIRVYYRFYSYVISVIAHPHCQDVGILVKTSS